MWTTVTIISIVIMLTAISVFFIEKKPKASNKLPFQVKNIVLPLAIALISTIVVIATFKYFPERVDYRFDALGNPNRSMAVYTYILLMLGVQFGIVLINIALNFALIKLSDWITKNSTLVFDASIMQLVITNIFIIPQIIMGFILLNSAYYCTNGAIIMAPMQFSLYVILASVLLLIVLFALGYKQTKNVMFKER